MNALATEINWTPLDERDGEVFAKLCSITAAARGVHPTKMFMHADLVAMQYSEPEKYDRWSLQRVYGGDLQFSWSQMLRLLRPLVGDRILVEVYPRDHQIINTSPQRWFWVLPSDEIPFEYDLRGREMI